MSHGPFNKEQPRQQGPLNEAQRRRLAQALSGQPAPEPRLAQPQDYQQLHSGPRPGLHLPPQEYMMSLPQSQVQEILLNTQQEHQALVFRVEQLEQQHLQEQSTHQVENHQQLQAQYELQRLQVEHLQLQVRSLFHQLDRQGEKITLLEKFTLKLADDVLKLMDSVKQYILQNMRV